MRDFYNGFEKKANLLAAGGKLLTRGATAVKNMVTGPNNIFTGRGTGARGMATSGAWRAAKTIGRHPMKSTIGGLTAADVVSSASQASKGRAGRTFRTGPVY